MFASVYAYGEAVIDARESEFNGYFQNGRYDDAMPIAKDMLAAAEKNADTDKVKYANALERVGMVYRAQALLPEARQHYEKALAVYQSIKPQDDMAIANAMNELGWICLSAGDREVAEEYCSGAVERLRKAGVNDNRLGIALENLADLYYYSGLTPRVADAYEEALVVYRKNGGEKSPSTVRTIERLADIYITMHKDDKAEKYLLETIKYYRETPYEGYAPKISAMDKLGDLFIRQGRYKEAVPQYVDAATAYKSMYKNNNSRAIKSLTKAVEACRLAGDKNKAEKLQAEINTLSAKQG
jgi:tetratricopeptide (TPR) repeat protein